MTDGIGRIFGGNSYGLGGYVPQRKEEEAPQDTVVTNNAADTQVDPAKVMEFMANNNFFVAAVKKDEFPEVDAATRARVENYMENFEMIYSVIVNEFGEDLAPDVMEIVMPRLLEVAA